MSEPKKTTYTIYTCDLCGRKQTFELAKFTLEGYGKVMEIAGHWHGKYICRHCETEIATTVEKIIRSNNLEGE